MNSKDLFAYGTLMDPRRMKELTSRELKSTPARLLGYERVRVREADYPALRRCVAGEVLGCVYQGLDAGILAKLDDYEGSEYERKLISVRGEGREMEVWCYFVRSELEVLLLSDEPWSLIPEIPGCDKSGDSSCAA